MLQLSAHHLLHVLALLVAFPCLTWTNCHDNRKFRHSIVWSETEPRKRGNRTRIFPHLQLSTRNEWFDRGFRLSPHVLDLPELPDEAPADCCWTDKAPDCMRGWITSWDCWGRSKFNTFPCLL